LRNWFDDILIKKKTVTKFKKKIFKEMVLGHHIVIDLLTIQIKLSIISYSVN